MSKLNLICDAVVYLCIMYVLRRTLKLERSLDRLWDSHLHHLDRKYAAQLGDAPPPPDDEQDSAD